MRSSNYSITYSTMNWNWKPTDITGSTTISWDTNIDNSDNWTIHSTEMDWIETELEMSIRGATSNIFSNYERTEIEEDELEWDAGEESSIEEVIDNAWATDTKIAKELWYLAQNWEKAISTWDGWYIMAPSDTIKMDALKTLAKMKGHFETKRKKKFNNKQIKYILIRDTQKNPLL